MRREDDGLDGLLCLGDGTPEVLAEDVVERPMGKVGCFQTGERLQRQMRRLEDHRLPIDEAEPLQVEQRVARQTGQLCGDLS